LSLVEIAIAPVLVYLAVQGFIATWLGLLLGKRIGSRLGDAAHALSGAVFVVLGLLIIMQTARNRNVF
jgi:putative Mn2+ efflux pump MntP